MLYYLDCFGLSLFALTGVVMAQKQDRNWVGGLIYALLTALGGGSLRDVLLGQLPVFWIRQPSYLMVASVAALLSLGLTSRWLLNLDQLWFLDAISLATFTIVGTQVALATQLSLGICVLMGTLTAVGGGLMRDALGPGKPFIFRESGYASASLLGGLTYAILSTKLGLQFAGLAAILVVVLIRYLARIRPRPTSHRIHTHRRATSDKYYSMRA